MNNKVIWITGASSGIGEALVYEYNKLGARLIMGCPKRQNRHSEFNPEFSSGLNSE